MAQATGSAAALCFPWLPPAARRPAQLRSGSADNPFLASRSLALPCRATAPLAMPRYGTPCHAVLQHPLPSHNTFTQISCCP